MRRPSGAKEGSAVMERVTCRARPNGESWPRAPTAVKRHAAAAAESALQSIETPPTPPALRISRLTLRRLLRRRHERDARDQLHAQRRRDVVVDLEEARGDPSRHLLSQGLGVLEAELDVRDLQAAVGKRQRHRAVVADRGVALRISLQQREALLVERLPLLGVLVVDLPEALALLGAERKVRGEDAPPLLGHRVAKSGLVQVRHGDGLRAERACRKDDRERQEPDSSRHSYSFASSDFEHGTRADYRVRSSPDEQAAHLPGLVRKTGKAAAGPHPRPGRLRASRALDDL